jgi:hypothetical protein
MEEKEGNLHTQGKKRFFTPGHQINKGRKNNPYGRKGFVLEKLQYQDLLKLCNRFILLAKKLYSNKYKKEKYITREEANLLLDKLFEVSTHPFLIFSRTKSGKVGYGYSPDDFFYLEEKIDIGKKILDKLHPDKKAETIRFDTLEVEQALNTLAQLVGPASKGLPGPVLIGPSMEEAEGIAGGIGEAGGAKVELPEIEINEEQKKWIDNAAGLIGSVEK